MDNPVWNTTILEHSLIVHQQKYICFKQHTHYIMDINFLILGNFKGMQLCKINPIGCHLLQMPEGNRYPNIVDKGIYFFSIFILCSVH